MMRFWVYTLFLVLSFAEQYYSTSNMCENPKYLINNTTDNLTCAFQLGKPIPDEGQCLITKRNPKFEKYCQDPHPYLGEVAMNFDWSAATYVKTYETNNSKQSYVGLNVTLTPRSRDTTGFVIWINVGTVNMCRVIEFQRIQVLKPETTTLWYDCSIFYPNETGVVFTLSLTEVPNNARKILKGRVPDVKHLDPGNIKQLECPILVDQITTRNREATIFFQPTPNVANYTVALIRNETVLKNYIVSATGERLQRESFTDLEAGEYSVNVTPIHSSCDGHCKTSTSPPFRIPELEGDATSTFTAIHGALVGAAVLILLFILISLLVYSARHHSIPGPEKPTVFLAYTFDNDPHFKLVDAFGKYLFKMGFDVKLDAWDPRMQVQNAFDWLTSSIDKADYVMIIWSDGAIRKAVENIQQLPGEHNHLTSHMFNTALRLIDDRYVRCCEHVIDYHPRSICNVFWEKPLNKSGLPMRRHLESFYLPKDVNRLLCYLLGYRLEQKLPCSSLLPRVHRKDSEEYKAFNSALRDYKEFVQTKGQREVNVNNDADQDEALPFCNGDIRPGYVQDAQLNDAESHTDEGYVSARLGESSDQERAPLAKTEYINEDSAQPVPHSVTEEDTTRILKQFFNGNEFPTLDSSTGPPLFADSEWPVLASSNEVPPETIIRPTNDSSTIQLLNELFAPQSQPTHTPPVDINNPPDCIIRL